jgi:hypothetical protein
MSRLYVIGALIIVSAIRLAGQEDLLSLVEEKNEGPKKVFATFKTVRICNAQTIETVKKKHLDFRIAHRFGNIYDATIKKPLTPVNEMFQTFFGFGSVSDVRFSLDYGVTDRLTFGIGRSKINKLLDGYAKLRILEQTTDMSVPVSMAIFSSLGYTHAHMNEAPLYDGVVRPENANELHRFNYFTELIIACKLNDWLSLEILPGYMHRNYIVEKFNSNNDAADQNSFFSLGVGGRLKLTKRMSIIGDYYYNFAPFYSNNTEFFNPLALGVEIETGGHVFSLVFTNASGLIENNYIPYTKSTWTKGQVKFGFVISRTFSL